MSEIDPSSFFDRMQPRLEYCSPEVVRSQLSGEAAPFSFASDFWSLGCTIYRMFFGSLLFSGSSPDAIRAAITSADAVPLKTTKSSLPTSSRSSAPSPSSDLIDILSRLLRKDHAARLTWPELLRHPFWHGALDALLSAPLPGSSPGPELLGTGGGEQQQVSQNAEGKSLANGGNALLASRSFDLTSNSTLKPTTNEPSHAQAQRGESKQVMLLTGAGAGAPEPLTSNPNSNATATTNANPVADPNQNEPQRPSSTSLRSLESIGTYFEEPPAAGVQQPPANPASTTASASAARTLAKPTTTTTTGSPPQEPAVAPVPLSGAASRKAGAQSSGAAALPSSRTSAQIAFPMAIELLFYEPGISLGAPDEAKAAATATGNATSNAASCVSAVGSTFALIRTQLTRLFSIKYDSKALPIQPYTSDKLLALPEKDRDRFFQSVAQALKHTAGPPTAKKMHLLSYLISNYLNPSLADVNLALSLWLLARGQVLGELLREIKEAASATSGSAFPGGNQDFRTRLAILLAQVVGTAGTGLFSGREAQQQTLAAIGAIDFGAVQSLVNLLVEQLRDQVHSSS